MFDTEIGPDWQPGDELYSRSAHPYSLYVFNFRDDSESDTCGCPDAASWPEPRSPHTNVGDDFARFLAECRSIGEAS